MVHPGASADPVDGVGGKFPVGTGMHLVFFHVGDDAAVRRGLVRFVGQYRNHRVDELLVLLTLHAPIIDRR